MQQYPDTRGMLSRRPFLLRKGSGAGTGLTAKTMGEGHSRFARPHTQDLGFCVELDRNDGGNFRHFLLDDSFDPGLERHLAHGTSVTRTCQPNFDDRSLDIDQFHTTAIPFEHRPYLGQSFFNQISHSFLLSLEMVSAFYNRSQVQLQLKGSQYGSFLFKHLCTVGSIGTPTAQFGAKRAN